MNMPLETQISQNTQTQHNLFFFYKKTLLNSTQQNAIQIPHVPNPKQTESR